MSDRPAWPWYIVTAAILLILLVADLSGLFDGLGP